MSIADTAVTVLEVVGAVAKPLAELVEYVQGDDEDPEREHQIALSIIRKAKDLRARREILGG